MGSLRCSVRARGEAHGFWPWQPGGGLLVHEPYLDEALRVEALDEVLPAGIE